MEQLHRPLPLLIRRKMTKEAIQELPKVLFPGKIHLVTTPEEADRAVTFLKQYTLLGIDTETRPAFNRGQHHKVALLQVATDDHCFLFRLNQIGLTLPVILLLENPHITKIGLSLKDDLMMLHKRAPFEPRGFVEIQDIVRPFGIEDLSLQKIYANLFVDKISTSQPPPHWEAERLTASPQRYAATDAWACLNIYHLLQELKESGDYELEPMEELKIENCN